MLVHSTFRGQLEVRVYQRIDLGVITQVFHLRSCLSCAALKAIEVTNVAEVVDSLVLKVVCLKERLEYRAAELTRLHNDPNRHFLELRALGKYVDANLSGFHTLLLMIKKKLPLDTFGVWRAFVQELTNEQIICAVFLSFLLSKSQIKDSARKMTWIQLVIARSAAISIPLRVTRDSSNSRVRNDGNVSINMDCVLDVCEQGTNPHLRQNRRQTRRPAVSRNARPVAQTDASLKEKRPTTASAQGSEAEDGPSGRAVTELTPVGVHFSSTVQAPWFLPPVVHAMTHDENGKKRLVNCILDSASEKLLIRTNIADELELRGTPSMVTVRGVHVLSARVADSHHVRFQLGPPHEEMAVSTKLELTALCISSICDDLIATLTPWPHEIDLHQAATLGTPPSLTSFYVLIRFDIYYRELGRGLSVAREDDSIAMETIFEWILCGLKVRCSAGKQKTTMVSTETENSSAETTGELNLLLRRFWEIDSIGVVQEAATDPDEEVKRKFKESVTFDGTRHVVVLLWRVGAVHLPDKHEVAMRGLRALRRQLNRDPEKDQEYSGVIHDYLDRGRESGWNIRSARKNLVPASSCRLPTQSRIALQADIEKMYLQVGLRVEDRDVCRFLWQERDCGPPVKVYRLTRVGFGLTCSPFLAMLVVKHHAQRRGNIDALTDRKTHGLQWNRHSDHLTFVPITDIHPERHDPKRQLISLASRLFDPLGCLAPFTIRAKRLFQSHWLKGLDWDDQLPIDINSVWCQWKRELHTLESVGVQRALMVTARDQVHQYELHVFADASEAAYCAVAYVMMESLDGIKVVRFCITKTCVTLVKRMSLPRLESMVSLRAACLKEYVERELCLPFN
ncbi:hypothetical protein T02_440 [Trichinella nativa]|uniref:Peptidase aspartic putative domain-containing protein n=1 Tax=Trichinella nativa TaxID=6335 RepID=A0A0V1L633_9BILA|nr:hypothetical protein T02_440 [Trichinella nativa]